ncbi:MAG: hypothetical protein OXC10_19045 [Rhodospirillaceae bacterium]|nr:hypothetical protein [Rhodospirillaceae bacterium]
MNSMGAGRISTIAFCVVVIAFALRPPPPNGAASGQWRLSPSAMAEHRSTALRLSTARLGPEKWVRSLERRHPIKHGMLVQGLIMRPASPLTAESLEYGI